MDPDPDADPNPALFVIDLRDADKQTNFLKSFSAYYFLKAHLLVLSLFLLAILFLNS
jgi:hypothetical protein